uniref:Uncharacterized protein n=1 Tax=Chromera velia CCMP2878 TaxID=1169474 RepID=A0A0G4HZS2_9ALVE|eukprot:Cvel_9795.t1-p1 / transcript=Cvel_9795.t1 / gene=Cvel_9795 / organism=Chromera_velia_CCMP2878 / gene_product=hypothetical protein / transcript_product=hypothetical protein / location=Cvel_scaffold574:77447-78883(+) / protein_length=201 / sequence_SO=supercontig / SO=protein_coding / is_pseudo=false
MDCLTDLPSESFHFSRHQTVKLFTCPRGCSPSLHSLTAFNLHRFRNGQLRTSRGKQDGERRTDQTWISTMKDMDTSAKQDPQRREEVPTRVLFSSSQRGRRERRSAEGAGSGGVSRQVSERDSERRRTETGAPWSSLQILEGRRRGRSANAQGKGTEGTDIFALARDEKRNDIQMGVLQPFEFFPLLARLEHLNGQPVCRV